MTENITRAVLDVCYAPDNEAERIHEDGRIENVAAGPWSLIRSFKFEGDEEPTIQEVWYFETEDLAKEFRELKLLKRPRLMKGGDILMNCHLCGTWEIQEEFGLDLEDEISTCPHCGGTKVVHELKTVHLE